MKKKKMLTENPNILLPEKKNGRLARYRARLEKERLEREKKRNALFRKRVNSASEKRAPETVRTKAYYRFSSEYPSKVSPDGFRENVPIKERMSAKAKIITALLCIFVFVFTLTALETGVILSRREPEYDTSVPAADEEQIMRISFISSEDFRSKETDEIIKELKKKKADTLLIEFKSEQGYVYFDVGSSAVTPADRKITDGAAKLKALAKSKVKCIAYISCFKDSVAAASLAGTEVLTASGDFFKDSSGAMWIDPYSDVSTEYLTGLMSKAIDAGFSSVMLDNVCFPEDYYLSAPTYMSFVEGDTKNGALTEFINKAVKTVGEDKLILCCDITAFAKISTLTDDRYGGILLGTDCISFCLDMRQDSQYITQLKNSEMFRYIEEMPLAFILDAGSLAIRSLGEKKEAYILYCFIDGDSDEAVQYAGFAGIKNTISDLS